MKTFKLPDLGEGLQDAELVEWLVQPGEHVVTDQLIAIVETAKAIVELPSPYEGFVRELFAQPGETVEVGATLISFADAPPSDEEGREVQVSAADISKADIPGANILEGDSSDAPLQRHSVSVVGNLESARDEVVTETFRYGSDASVPLPSKGGIERSPAKRRVLATPAVLAMAAKLGVTDELSKGEYSDWTAARLLDVYKTKSGKKPSDNNAGLAPIKLSGARKVMAQSMAKSHQQVPAVTLFDDADLGHWSAKQDITLRCIRAVIKACAKVPILNAWFDEEEMSIQPFDDVHLGVAVNTDNGLFVPVIRHVQTLVPQRIREILDKQIIEIKQRRIKPQKLLGATISLSNFGTLAGRYATPIIVPPQVAILGVGKLQQVVKLVEGQVVACPVLPLSLSFDHRAASGAEAALFLQTLIEDLQLDNH